MRYLLLALAVCLSCLVAMPAMAEDGKNVPDMVADVLSGRQDSCPTVLSLEFAVEIDVANIPLMNLIPILNSSTAQVGVKGLTPMGENFAKEGEFEIPVRFIWKLD